MNKANKLKRIIKTASLIILVGVVILLLIPIGIGTYYFHKADFKCPTDSVYLSDFRIIQEGDSMKIIDNDFLHLNEYGLWEVRVSGNAIQRGGKYGLLTKELLQYQESVFVEQIKEIIPSDAYLKFLHKLVAIFNWDMANHIPEEYRKEIYAISKSCSHEFDAFGTPYERQLNYHAAHDIGHAMQEYMLVGCSSFAAWDAATADSNLIVGRNFDFYVGDDFARNKIVLFMEPDNGYKFASVTWPGMMGVVSGMNECGLSVTINASKGAMPVTSAMPISLLVRDILQNASNIKEAFHIAKEHKTFVSESILLGSDKDGCAAIIEKSPDMTALYNNHSNYILCTNHYQSEEFKYDHYNIENIANSDSKYRLDRLKQLVDRSMPLNCEKAASILRDRKGVDDKDIGYTNQKSINQSIAHHSVIFQPHNLKMWVSTSPWQDGSFICYDLNKVFSSTTFDSVLYDTNFTVPEDSSFVPVLYDKVVQFRAQSRKIKTIINGKELLTDKFVQDYISLNPCYFGTYELVGDYYLKINDTSSAVKYWKKALEFVIPSKPEKQNIINKINRHD